MAHFAEINNNEVIRVVVIDNINLLNDEIIEDETKGIEYCKNLFGEDTSWVQTSYNGTFRKNYASLGFIYDLDRDAFIPPKLYDSWTLDEDTCSWKPPIPYPFDPDREDDIYKWNETAQAWDLVVE